MEHLTAEEAARLLRVDVRRIQTLARAGKLPARRVGRRWLFERHALEELLGTTLPQAPRPAATLSARNRLRGTILSLRVEGLMAEVVLDIAGQELVSIITRDSAERLGLAVGDPAYAVVKATEVMIGKDS